MFLSCGTQEAQGAVYFSGGREPDSRQIIAARARRE